MGKGVLKYGGKSGVLPSPRQIFKKPIKPVVVDRTNPQGYAENIPHPKGSTRNPEIPRPFTLEQRVAQILPKHQLNIDEKLAKLTQQGHEAKKYKVIRSELRKQYLIEALREEEGRLHKEDAKQKTKQAQEHKKAEELKQMDLESQTTRLTLPTIESYLEGPIMRERTPEENKLLRLKKKSNRLTHELQVKENKAINLLDLYYESENFVIDEERLALAIDKAFENSDYYASVLAGVRRKLQDFTEYEDKYMEKVNDKFNYVLFGSAFESRPGIYEIEDNLSGEFSQLAEEANKKVEQQSDKEKEKLLNSLDN